MSASRPPVVLDNGTGYTKMGYAGNWEPNFIIPSVISTATSDKKTSAPSASLSSSSTSSTLKSDDVADLDFFIGAEASEKRLNYNVDYPIREGVVDNWDNMEKYTVDTP